MADTDKIEEMAVEEQVPQNEAGADDGAEAGENEEVPRTPERHTSGRCKLC